MRFLKIHHRSGVLHTNMACKTPLFIKIYAK